MSRANPHLEVILFVHCLGRDGITCCSIYTSPERVKPWVQRWLRAGLVRVRPPYGGTNFVDPRTGLIRFSISLSDLGHYSTR